MNETVTWEDLSEVIEKDGAIYALTEYYDEEDLEGIEDRRLRKAALSVRSSLMSLSSRIEELRQKGWLDNE